MDKPNFYNYITNYERKEFKIAVIGNYAVGKSSLIRRFVDDKFIENKSCPTKSTTEYEFQKTSYDTIMLNIWDTMGNNQFHSLMGTYLKSVDGIIIVRDISTETKEEHDDTNINNWLESIKKTVHCTIPIIIAMNKSDLESSDLESSGLQTILHKNNECIYTSAKTGSNVKLLFSTMVKNMIENANKKTKKDVIKLSSIKNKYAGKCSY